MSTATPRRPAAAPAPARRRDRVAALGIGPLALAVMSTFLPWPTGTGRPSAWSLAALAAAVVAAAVLAAGARWTAPVAGALALASVLPIVGPLRQAAGELGRGDPIARTGPLWLAASAAATLALASAARAAGPDDRWEPARRAVGVVVALALAAGAVVTVRLAAAGATDLDAGGADRPGSAVERPRVEDLLPVDAVTGPARPTAVAAGVARAIAGRFVLVVAEPLGKVVVVDARSGRTAWELPLRRADARTVAVGDAFVVIDGGEVVVHDAGTGSRRWASAALDAVDAAPAADGVAVLGRAPGAPAGAATITVLDATTGAVRRSFPVTCDEPPSLVPVRVLAVVCRAAGGTSIRVYGAPTAEPTWTAASAAVVGLADAGAGLVVVRNAPSADQVVDTVSGAVVLTPTETERVIGGAPAGTVLTVDPDGRLRRYDLATPGAAPVTVPLEDGDEDDLALLDDGAVGMAGGRLVASRPGGVGTERSPAGERRHGVVVWDPATGRRLTRVLTGPVVAAPAVLPSWDVAVGDEVVVLGTQAVGPRGPDGRPLLDHVLIFSVPFP